MKLSPHRIRAAHQRGSILVICMVLAGLGTIGAAAFFSLMQAKTQETAEREVALQRRTKLANSRALAKEALLHQDLGAIASPAGGTRTFSLADSWGGITIATYPTAPLAASSSLRLHKTGALPLSSFTQDISVTLGDGDASISFQAQAKSLHPALGGDLLVVNRPWGTGTAPTELAGNLHVKGRAVLYGATYSTTTSPIRTDRVIMANHAGPKIALLNVAGTAILPENGPLPPTTTGYVAGAPNLSNQMSVFGNPNSTVNDYDERVGILGGLSLAGGTAEVVTSAAATVAAGINDAALLAILDPLTSPLPGSLPATLSTQGLLSSSILTSLISKATLVDSTVLTAILISNSPLPRDVLIQVVNGTAPLTPAHKWHIIRNNPVAFAVDNTGLLYVDLDHTQARSLAVSEGITSIILKGQETSAAATAAASMTPIVIGYQDGISSAPTLTSLQLEGENGRPLILALSNKGSAGTVTTTFTHTSGFPTWRGLLEVENYVLAVTTSAVSAATLVGGIRTDRSLNITAGTLTLDRETDAATLSALQSVACRNAWLEMVNVN